MKGSAKKVSKSFVGGKSGIDIEWRPNWQKEISRTPDVIRDAGMDVLVEKGWLGLFRRDRLVG